MRGVFHVHTSRSHDGELPLSALAALLRGQCLDFCVLTDHSDDLNRDNYAEQLVEIDRFNSCNDFKFVPGIEMSCKVAHIILIDAPEHPMTTDWREVVEFARSRGVVSVLAHPHRSVDSVATSEILMQVEGVEIWNTREDGRFCPDVRKIGLLGNAIRESHLLFFGVDFHSTGDCVENVIQIASDTQIDGRLSNILSTGAYRNVNEATGTSLSSRSQNVIEALSGAHTVVKRADRQRTFRQLLKGGGGVLRTLGLRTPRWITHVIKRYI